MSQQESNATTIYAHEKQNEFMKKFSKEYSNLFEYKSLKRFWPEKELSSYDEEILKTNLHAQAKKQEAIFFSIYEKSSELFKMNEVVAALYEIKEKNLITKENTSHSLLEFEKSDLTPRMFMLYKQYLKKQIELLDKPLQEE